MAEWVLFHLKTTATAVSSFFSYSFVSSSVLMIAMQLSNRIKNSQEDRMKYDMNADTH